MRITPDHVINFIVALVAFILGMMLTHLGGSGGAKSKAESESDKSSEWTWTYIGNGVFQGESYLSPNVFTCTNGSVSSNR